MDDSAEILISQNAFRDIVLEVGEHQTVETGGILLGVRDGTKFYVAAAIDPGPRSVRRPAYFEYNHDYATHLANVVARRYRTPLVLLGLWHRHPGSLDTFSSTDDRTHDQWLRMCRVPIISGLVNIDPEFRITFYRVDQDVSYAQINYETGDHHFPPGLLDLKESETVRQNLAMPRMPTWFSPPTKFERPNANRLPISKIREPSFLGRLIDLTVGRKTTGTTHPPSEIPDSPAIVESDPSIVGPVPTTACEHKTAMGMLDEALDYLDAERPRFAYEVSPQEPGFRLAVTAARGMAANENVPERVEFVFYCEGLRAVVAINGSPREYEADIVRRFYVEYAVSRDKLADATEGQGQQP